LIIGYDADSDPITLSGPNTAGGGFGLTEIDEAVWSAWKATPSGRALLASGAVFDATGS
jgi:hypothetical protein